MRTKMLPSKRLQRLNAALGKDESEKKDALGSYMQIYEQIEAEIKSDVDTALSAAEAQLAAANAFRESAKEEIEAAKKAAAEARKQMEEMNVSRETLKQDNQNLQAEINTLNQTVASMQGALTERQEDAAEMRAIKKAEADRKAMSKKMDAMQKTMSGFLQSLQIGEESPEKEAMEIPSFDVIPVMDGAGNIVGAKVTPIRGH